MSASSTNCRLHRLTDLAVAVMRHSNRSLKCRLHRDMSRVCIIMYLILMGSLLFSALRAAGVSSLQQWLAALVECMFGQFSSCQNVSCSWRSVRHSIKFLRFGRRVKHDGGRPGPASIATRDLHGNGKLTHPHLLPQHFLSIPIRPPVQIQNSPELITNWLTFPAIIIYM